MIELNKLAVGKRLENPLYILYNIAIRNDVFNRTKQTIIKTIEQELWPLEGYFDEIDEIIEEFERKVREVELY